MGGHAQTITPNLSEFAKEAVVFQNAYCASPSCNPSRTAILTACTKNVSLVDIFPTLTELCGLPPKEGVSGNSLMPLLRNPADTTWDYPVVTMLGNNHFSIRKDEWHYIIYDGSEAELYNLKDDPEEWSNLIGMPGYLDIIKELRQYIPTERKELVKTKPIRWADVLSGETKFYE